MSGFATYQELGNGHGKMLCRAHSMNLPSFHDGRFDGFYIGADEVVYLFLKTQSGERLTLILRGVERLSLSEIKEGNIIFDLCFRDAEKLTASDIEELYQVSAESTRAADLLDKVRKQGFQVLEINPSYGALALFLFRAFEIAKPNCSLIPD
jgi:hypothetical protein